MDAIRAESEDVSTSGRSALSAAIANAGAEGDIGVLLCGHGSRAPHAVAEFAALAGAFAARVPDVPLAYGYLEFARPVLREALDTLRDKGVRRILALPGMLFAATHLKNDIPSVLNTYAAREGLRIDLARELGLDAAMLAAAADRVRAALHTFGPDVASESVCLVVVGRGASDPDANANVAKLTRLLHEGFGFGWSQTAYSGVTFPQVAPCLDAVAKLGFSRIIVFPYFLFSGVLIDRIYGFADEVARRHPQVAIAKAPYLGTHEGVLETFEERAAEALRGEAVMNCSLCKYRTQVLGFEAEAGAPQESHHHHVEGQGPSAPGSSVATCTLCDTWCTGACRVLKGPEPPHAHGPGDHHDHHHHHHQPYPHEAHPFGPASVVRSGQITYLSDPEAIARRSFEIIAKEVDLSRFADAANLAARIVHASGDPAVIETLHIEGTVVAAVRQALAAGARVVVDAKMTRHAIAARAVPAVRVLCPLATTSAEAASREGTTRSALAIRRAATDIEGAVVVIGNAPTALFELLSLLRADVKPAAVLAFPVGFVGAVESKEALIAMRPDVPFVTLRGRRGGSAIAGAAFNALALR